MRDPLAGGRICQRGHGVRVRRWSDLGRLAGHVSVQVRSWGGDVGGRLRGIRVRETGDRGREPVAQLLAPGDVVWGGAAFVDQVEDGEEEQEKVWVMPMREGSHGSTRGRARSPYAAFRAVAIPLPPGWCRGGDRRAGRWPVGGSWGGVKVAGGKCEGGRISLEMLAARCRFPDDSLLARFSAASRLAGGRARERTGRQPPPSRLAGLRGGARKKAVPPCGTARISSLVHPPASTHLL